MISRLFLREVRKEVKGKKHEKIGKPLEKKVCEKRRVAQDEAG